MIKGFNLYLSSGRTVFVGYWYFYKGISFSYINIVSVWMCSWIYYVEREIERYINIDGIVVFYVVFVNNSYTVEFDYVFFFNCLSIIRYIYFIIERKCFKMLIVMFVFW